MSARPDGSDGKYGTLVAPKSKTSDPSADDAAGSLDSMAVDSTLSTVLPATVDGSLAATSSVVDSPETDKLSSASALAVSASLAMGVAKNEYLGGLSPPFHNVRQCMAAKMSL